MRVLLVDDHALFREGLQNLLNAQGLQIVGTASDGFDALEKARAVRPDVILMDIRMPGCDGLAATRLIKAEQPAVKIVMLTTSAEDADLFEAIRIGASGYLLKSLSAAELFEYLAGLEKGEAPLSPYLATRLLQEFARQPGEATAEPAGNEAQPLTARQKQILTLVAQGLTYKEIGARLSVSEHTVKYHMGDILRRLHLKNRAEVVAYAVRSGLVKDSPPL